MTPTCFRTPAAFRAWLAKHHRTSTEFLLGFYKVDAPKSSITYPQALDEALCVGWIDGVRKRLDDVSYTIRFTPRTPRSYWSTVNIRKAEVLIAAGRMKAAGLAAFEARGSSAARRYSFENRPQELPPAMAKQFKANTAAWKYYNGLPPWYRRVTTWYVVSAKQEATRAKRLATLIGLSARGKVLPGVKMPAKRRA